MSLVHTCRVAAVALAATAASLVLTPSASAIDTGFQYELNPQHNSGMCLDIQGGSTENGAQLIQFDCTNRPNQRFRFFRIAGNVYQIRAVHSDRCLDVWGGSIENGAQLIQFDCGNQANQRFRLLEDSPSAGLTSRIAAVHSGRCLDVRGASNANSAHVIQFDCGNQANQRFDARAFQDR